MALRDMIQLVARQGDLVAQAIARTVALDQAEAAQEAQFLASLTHDGR